MKKHFLSRRRFIYNIGLASLSLPILSNCDTEPSKKKTMSIGNKEKLGIALVGLGNYATGLSAQA